MDRYKLTLLAIFLVALVWSAIHPLSQSNWLLENMPIFVALLFFIILNNYIKLSDLSYTLILIYLLLPLVGSHYGVSEVPIGDTIGHLLGADRNMYDRLVHFSFGFLGFYPIQEFFDFVHRKESGLNYYITLATIVAFAGIYEIFEWVAAITVNPRLAASFYGAQGDVFDTQKDMAVSIVGTFLAMTIVFLLRKYKKAAL